MRSYVHARFDGPSQKVYTYIADGSVEELKRYTFAVVMTPQQIPCIVTIDNVSELDESTYNGEYKDVIIMFNLDEYNEKLARRKRKSALEKELRKRVAKRNLEDNFAKLLAGDEDSMKLLDEYRSL